MIDVACQSNEYVDFMIKFARKLPLIKDIINIICKYIVSIGIVTYGMDFRAINRNFEMQPIINNFVNYETIRIPNFNDSMYVYTHVDGIINGILYEFTYNEYMFTLNSSYEYSNHKRHGTCISYECSHLHVPISSNLINGCLFKKIDYKIKESYYENNRNIFTIHYDDIIFGYEHPGKVYTTVAEHEHKIYVQLFVDNVSQVVEIEGYDDDLSYKITYRGNNIIKTLSLQSNNSHICLDYYKSGSIKSREKSYYPITRQSRGGERKIIYDKCGNITTTIFHDLKSYRYRPDGSIAETYDSTTNTVVIWAGDGVIATAIIKNAGWPPFSRNGTCTEYNLNGEVTKVWTKRYNQLHGEYLEYTNGINTMRCTYKNGKLSGQMMSYDPTTCELTQCSFKMDKHHGPYVLRKNGIVIVQCTYSAGKLVGNYYEMVNGNLQITHTVAPRRRRKKNI
jgi:antitoxin component YwqK of YwqJK toxin-antitoxin module